MASSRPPLSQAESQPSLSLTEAETTTIDYAAVSSLSCSELVQSMTRIAQRLFHHIEPTQQPRSSDGDSGRAKAKRKRPTDERDEEAERRWRLHERDEAIEEEEAQQTSAFHLPSFLSSAASPALFHRLASQPSAFSSLPRFVGCLSSLRAMLVAHSQRLRSAPAPLLDRLLFSSQSLSSLLSHHSSVSAALRLCRDRLREEVDSSTAAASHEEHYLHVHRLLHRMRRQLRLVSEDEQDTADRALLLPSPALSGSGSGSAAEAAEETVHLASAGVVGCFVIEIKLRRRERDDKERHSEMERRRKEAAAVGAALSAPPLHDCIVSVKADFLQGDAELHEPQIDCELYALLANCRFAALQTKLSHALTMEGTADRYPQMALYSRKADVLAALNECRDRSKLPCVLLNAVDGPQLAFQHLHTAADAANQDERRCMTYLFFSAPSTRLCFASQPALSFTHSITYIGMEEIVTPTQANQPAQSASSVLALSSSSSSPTLSHLLSLTPSVVVPYSTLRSIARMAAGDSERGHSHSSHPQPQQPAMAYHDFIAGTSPSAASRLSARLSVLSTTQHFTLTNDATLIEDACTVSYIPVVSLRALSSIVHTLRQYIAFNQLYASCFRQSPTTRSVASMDGGATPSAAVSVEVTAFPPHTLRLRIGHPSAAGQYISLDIRLTPGEPHEPCTPLVVQTSAAAAAAVPACFDCHCWSVQLDRSFDSVAPCSDSFALRLLCMTQSVPALVHAVVSRAIQQQANGSSNGHKER